jgi:hypothetical protein
MEAKYANHFTEKVTACHAGSPVAVKFSQVR